MIKTDFLGDEVPKENKYYICIACITIDSVVRMEKIDYPLVYVEESKCRMKKTKTTKFIEAKLESESESEFDIEFEPKSELESDTEQLPKQAFWEQFKVLCSEMHFLREQF